MTYLLDTNIIVFLLRGREEIARAIDNVGMQNCAISEVTKAELLSGYYMSKMLGRNPSPKIFDFLDAITVLPFSSSIDTYSRELARLQLAGIVIEDFDLIIASTAVANGLILVTDNTSHLSRVRGVVLENWRTW